MKKGFDWGTVLLLGGLGLIAYFLLKKQDGFLWGGGGGGGTVVIPSSPLPATVITPEPLPTPISTTINLYNQLPQENKLAVPGSNFEWKPYTESGKLTVFPIVTDSLTKRGVIQKYAPATQLITPQAKMLMDLNQKLTPSVTYNTGAGVRLPAPTLSQTLNSTTPTVNKAPTINSISMNVAPSVERQVTNIQLAKVRGLATQYLGTSYTKLISQIRSV